MENECTVCRMENPSRLCREFSHMQHNCQEVNHNLLWYQGFKPPRLRLAVNVNIVIMLT